MTNIQLDFEEFLRLLEDESVRYLIVGGYAVAFHGFPRFTKDIDIFYAPQMENIHRLKSALLRFGFTSGALKDSLFQPGNIIKMGNEPIRIDLLNEIDGLDFAEAFDTSVRGNYGKVSVTFIGFNALVKNKQATGRLQDLADLEKLTGKSQRF